MRCKDNYYFRSSKKILNFSTIFKWLLARRELSLCKLVVKDKFRMINKFQFDIRLIFATLNGKVSAAIYQQLQKNFTKNGIPITPDGWTILIYLWEKDGVKRYTTEVIVDIGGTMQMLDSRGDNDGASRAPVSRPQSQPQQQPQSQPQQQQRPAPSVQHDAQPAPDYDSFDDDFPF